MKGIFVYRLLRIVLNFFCLMLALQTLVVFFALIGNPALYLPLFIIICVILYGWYANVFFIQVIIRKQTIRKRSKDMLMVNGIVTFLFGLLLVGEVIYLYKNPKQYTDALLAMNPEFPKAYISNMLLVLLFFGIIILAHTIWTFILLRQRKDAVVSAS